LLPQILRSFIAATHQSRYPLFTQPSSSKLPLDVFVAEKVRGSVRTALGQIMAFVGTAEEGCMPSASTSTANAALSPTQVDLLSAVWKCRQAIWEAIATWGGYVETEAAWGELVEAEARRAESVLMTHGGLKSEADDEGLAGKVLRTLVVLESLDHGRTRVGSEVLGWCLAVSPNTRFHYNG
jgi:hypothetical protein